MHGLEKHIELLRELQLELMNEARKPSLDIETQRTLTKEAQKIKDELDLMEDAGKNVVEIKVYAYEMYNSVPAGLEKITQANGNRELNDLIEKTCDELEKLWYFVNK